MKHPDDEQLIALFYGEAPRGAGIEEHLRACEPCRKAFETLEHTLAAFQNTPIPNRDTNYGSQVWYAIAGRLDAPQKQQRHSRRSWSGFRRLAATSALAAAILAAFFAGRYWPRPQIRTTSTDRAQIRRGVLLVAVADHLDHAQMVLMELVNADGDQAPPTQSPATVNISRVEERAQELLVSNRLYQQTAQQTGDAALENILNSLEPVLLEIAHDPDQISRQQFREIQERIRAAGILFKVRVVSSQVRDKEQSMARQNGQGQS